ncbi:MAG: phosphopyruvate hydratase [Clostridia bacterium]|nr:phosphopyruvate hydratase [Clostridia bacterium]
MNRSTLITEIKGRQIFDSRGNPTVWCRVRLQDGSLGCASVPSGASTGRFEAVELRDRERAYGGMGVIKAVYSVNGKIAEGLLGMDAADQRSIDTALCRLDGSINKEVLGANATLAVSLACAKAAAASYALPLYRYLGGALVNRLPLPFMNVLNGGKHADNGLTLQEYMIIPLSATSFAGAMRMGSEIYHALKSILREDDHRISLGDEGGFAPMLKTDEEALGYLLRAIEFAGYEPGKDAALAVDAAASEWYREGLYRFKDGSKALNGKELVDYYEELCRRYPIVSIEDPFHEEDFDSFSAFTSKCGKKIQIVGDDLFVTNALRLKEGIKKGCCNCVLLKPNQVGTLSETIDTANLALSHGYRLMPSHRSGETEDTLIADISVALCSGQIKTGAPARGERTAKYNRLLEIEDELAPHALYGLC